MAGDVRDSCDGHAGGWIGVVTAELALWCECRDQSKAGWW
jgi:hypothetical protein